MFNKLLPVIIFAGFLLTIHSRASVLGIEDVVLNDGQIAQLIVSAGLAEIAGAELAKKKTENVQAGKLADMLIEDHTAFISELEKVLTRNQISMQDSEYNRLVVAMSKVILSKLKALNGKEFEKTFANYEVDGHTQVLQIAKSTLIPSVTNADLKVSLENEIPLLQRQLDQAIAFQKSLAR